MQQKSENSDKPPIIQKRKILITIVLLIVAVTSWCNRGSISAWFDSYNHKIVHEARPNESTDLGNQTIGAIESSDSALSSAETNEADLGQQIGNTNVSETTHDGKKLQNEHDNIIHVNNYRRYLYNVNGLIANFLQDKAYSSQIAYIRILSLPPSIETILELFEQYNIDYLVSPDAHYKKVFPKSCKVSCKFIKIKKLTEKSKDKDKLKAIIMNNLDIFQDYIYSETLQKIFTGQPE